MPNYAAKHYDPPAPVAQVMLRDKGSGAMVADVSLLVDSGADITLLPRHAVERLGVKPLADNNYQLVAFDGRSSTAQAVELDMIFRNKAYRGRYLLIDGDHGVLGRDVMSSWSIILDGPEQHWMVDRETASEGSAGNI